jgi:hypothetical protein
MPADKHNQQFVPFAIRCSVLVRYIAEAYALRASAMSPECVLFEPWERGL